MTETEQPRLVAQGDPRWNTPVLGLLYLLGPFVLVFLYTGVLLLFPDLPRTTQAIAFALGATLAFWASWLLIRKATRRKGSARFFAERIVIEKGWRHTEQIAWSDVREYSAPKEGYVQLHRVGTVRAEIGLTIPTPGDEVRARVFEELQERGITRR